MSNDREMERRATLAAADQGRLIEHGWLGLRAGWISDDAPAQQIDEMRNAFFAGVQHALAAMAMIGEDGEEASTDELRRMEGVERELDRFFEEFKRLRLGQPTALMSAAIAKFPPAVLIGAERVDRALRDASAECKGSFTAGQAAMILTFPLLALAKHSPPETTRAALNAIRAALRPIEQMVERRETDLAKGAKDGN